MRGPGGIGVNDVPVQLYELSTGATAWASSGLGGSYSVDDLAPGTYVVYFGAAAGLLGQWHDGVYGSLDATPVEITDGATIVIDVQLEEPGSISGAITLPSGDPVDGWRAISVVGTRSSHQGYGGVRNDGTYVITGLVPDDYLVRIIDYAPDGHVDEFYDDGTLPGDAVLVPVAGGATTTGVDVRLDLCGAPSAFSDVPLLHRFCKQIDWLESAGIASGYPDGTYRPTAPVTRAAMAAHLYRLAGSPTGPFPDPGFDDVPPGHPFEDEIAWIAAAGIASGYPDGTFRPGRTVSRWAAATFLFRTSGDPAPDTDEVWCQWSDVCPPDATIGWLTVNGIMDGYADGTFRPSAPVSRQSMASILYWYRWDREYRALIREHPYYFV